MSSNEIVLGSDLSSLPGTKQANRTSSALLKIPHDRITVVTGPSGSGKSRLAFKKIHQEMSRLVAGWGLEPAASTSLRGMRYSLAISDSWNISRGEIVAEMSRILPLLQDLFGKEAQLECPVCTKRQRPIDFQECQTTIQEIDPGDYYFCVEKDLAALSSTWLESAGILRFLSDGELYDRSELSLLEKGAVVFPIVQKLRLPATEIGLCEAIEHCCQLGDGKFIVQEISSGTSTEFVLGSKCRKCAVELSGYFEALKEFPPCEACEGAGKSLEFDTKLLLASKGNLSQALIPFQLKFLKKQKKDLEAICSKLGLSLDADIADTRESELSKLLYGAEGNRSFEDSAGLAGILRQYYLKTKSEARKSILKCFTRSSPCPSCQGSGLGIGLKYFYLGERNLHDYFSLPISSVLDEISGLALLSSNNLLSEISRRLRFFCNTGLSYLSLGRQLSSLSSGELLRTRLSPYLAGAWTGLVFVIEAPLSSLFFSERKLLWDSFRQLQEQNNTLIITSNDSQAVTAADHVLEMSVGGSDSFAAEKLGYQPLTLPETEVINLKAGPILKLSNLSCNNLQNLSLELPLEKTVALVGCSGSGKTTLLEQGLYRELSFYLEVGKDSLSQAEASPLSGSKEITRVVLLNREHTLAKHTSSVGMILGVWDKIRNSLALSREARAVNMNAGDFSYAKKPGRCESCLGLGCQASDKSQEYLSPCNNCLGSRYSSALEEFRWRGKSAAELSLMNIESASVFFQFQPSIAAKLELAVKLGCGSLQLAQSGIALSSGELLRLSLAREVAAGLSPGGGIVFLLDEPGRGLNAEESEQLLEVFSAITKAGHSVILSDHNPKLIEGLDYLIELGPGGGDLGGEIIRQGRVIAKR